MCFFQRRFPTCSKTTVIDAYVSSTYIPTWPQTDDQRNPEPVPSRSRRLLQSSQFVHAVAHVLSDGRNQTHRKLGETLLRDSTLALVPGWWKVERRAKDHSCRVVPGLGGRNGRNTVEEKGQVL